MTAAAETELAPPQQPEQVEIVLVEDIRRSATNPRKHNREPDPEFVESVRVHGVLQPVVVTFVDDQYELVFGEMRWLACKIAGRKEIPAIVRTMEPDEIFEVQVIENSQRKDVHPLDESDAFAELVKRGYPLQRIADRLGRPIAYVAQRLKLRELGKAGRAALDEERISLAVALQIARIPGDKLQAEALDEVAPEGRGSDFREVMTSSAAAQAIRERFMLKLVDAKFDRADPALVPKAGPCTTCPKRTGNQGELFSDVDSPDLCTDLACFRSKNDAWWKTAAVEAKKSGRTVLSEAESKKVFPNEYGGTRGFEPLDGEIYGPTGRNVKIKKLLGKDVETVLARNPHTGQVVDLVPRALVDKALRAKKATTDEPTRAKATPAEKAKLAREKLKKQAADIIYRRIATQAASQLSAMGHEAADAVLLPFLLPALMGGLFGDEETELLKRRGIVKPKTKAGHDWVEKRLLEEAATTGVAWTRGLLLELALIEEACGSFEHSKRVQALLKELDVDRKAIESQVLKELKGGPSPKGEPGVCRECGCSEEVACNYGGKPCHWVEPDLCSACATKKGAHPATKSSPGDGKGKPKPKSPKAQKPKKVGARDGAQAPQDAGSAQSDDGSPDDA